MWEDNELFNMRIKRNKLVGKEYLVPIVITLLFISPAIFIKTGPRLWYGILAGAIGWGLGRYIILTLRRKKKEKKRFISNPAIWIYVALYLLVSLYLDSVWLNKEFLLYFLLKNVIIGCFWLLHAGLVIIQTKKMWLSGFPLTKKASVVYGILMVIISLLILFTRPLISIFGGLN